MDDDLHRPEAYPSVPGGTLGSVIIDVPGGSVSSIVRGEGPITLVLAHGAGTDQHHRSIVGIAESVARRGIRVVTFNYPYTEAGRRGPDRAPVLLACHRAVADEVTRRFGGGIFLGGRSMGGRMATMLVADGYPAAGLVLYAYPLHPAGRPEKLRVDHLPAVGVPMLYFQGTRDALSRPELFDTHIRPLPGVTVVELPGGDHSFRGTGLSEPDLYELLAQETGDWIGTVG